MDSTVKNPFLTDEYSNDNSNPTDVSNPFLNFGAIESAPAIVQSNNPFFSLDTSSGSEISDIPTNPFAFDASSHVSKQQDEELLSTQISKQFEIGHIGGDDQQVSSSSNIEIAGNIDDSQHSISNILPSPHKPPSQPPPRPPAPPRNTQDLILSVTGAMDETSNQILDRLHATKTPSPTLLHSPSPTPENSFAEYIEMEPDACSELKDNLNPESARNDNQEIQNSDDNFLNDTLPSKKEPIAEATSDPINSDGIQDLVSIGYQENSSNGMESQQSQRILKVTQNQDEIIGIPESGKNHTPEKICIEIRASTSESLAEVIHETRDERSDVNIDNGTGNALQIDDPFLDRFENEKSSADPQNDVWGDSTMHASEPITGFDESDDFDSFLSMTAPPKEQERSGPHQIESRAEDEASYAVPSESPRFNPFDKSAFASDALPVEIGQPAEMTRTDSQETPPTPLFDEDVSQPLEDFPRINYSGEGWEMQLRMPIKKKITGQRFWKKVFVKLVYQGDNPILQLFNVPTDKDPFQELPLLACYSVSEIAAQQYDQYGKIFTVKLQYIFYKERPGVRPGQVTKAERLTNKLSQFAAYAIQGDYQGCKEFGSDLKKLGLPVEHAPQVSQLFKLGSHDYEDLKQFSCIIEEALFKISIHRDRALQYKMEEVQITVVDELYVEQNAEGHVEKQIARVRLFFLGFLSGMPDVELGINDMWRQGKEVVGRHDIIPMATEEWIRLENVEFHSCIQQDEYEKTRIIKFKPPDACYIELMRFRVRPPRNRELPLQLKAVMCVTGNKVELRADVLVPGFASRKLGRVPCEDVSIRFPIPECWIYLFRVEKHFRYGSVKSAHRRTGKIKGIERFLGAVDNLEPQLMEVTSGQAKYEHQHRAIVWRMPRLPKEGQGAYTTHQLVCRMNLTSYDQIPQKLAEYCYVEFTMPATQVSHTTARSCSFVNHDSDTPPEKYVRNLSRHEYRVGIEHTTAEGPGAYVTATVVEKVASETVKESKSIHTEGNELAASDSDSSE